jgi:four helix bundle protein
MNNNPTREKSYAFAVRIVKLAQWLETEKKERTLSRQILRSGTSIGANAEEACGSYSKKEFAAKIQIAMKEAMETSYWLRLLKDTNYLDEKAFDSLHSDCVQLIKMLTATTKTLKQKVS